MDWLVTTKVFQWHSDDAPMQYGWPHKTIMQPCMFFSELATVQFYNHKTFPPQTILQYTLAIHYL